MGELLLVISYTVDKCGWEYEWIFIPLPDISLCQSSLCSLAIYKGASFSVKLHPTVTYCLDTYLLQILTRQICISSYAAEYGTVWGISRPSTSLCITWLPLTDFWFIVFLILANFKPERQDGGGRLRRVVGRARARWGGWKTRENWWWRAQRDSDDEVTTSEQDNGSSRLQVLPKITLLGYQSLPRGSP